MNHIQRLTDDVFFTSNCSYKTPNTIVISSINTYILILSFYTETGLGGKAAGHPKSIIWIHSILLCGLMPNHTG